MLSWSNLLIINVIIFQNFKNISFTEEQNARNPEQSPKIDER